MTTDTSATDIEYISIEERLRVLVEHTRLFVELLPFKNFAVMKKHYKAYVGGWHGAAELRHHLMEQDTPAAVARVVEDYLASQK
jgi:tRNA-dihydrouridine synthase